MITVKDAAGKVDTFTVTPEHPFLTPAATWHTISGFKIGDEIASSSGKPVTITAIKGDASERDVYNLTINEDHSYAVGELGGWSHNISKMPPGTGIGPFARMGVRLRKPYGRPLKADKDLLQAIGNTCGCHTCGARIPGTSSGKWILDHLPSQKSGRTPIWGFPHCIQCARRQGGLLSAYARKK